MATTGNSCFWLADLKKSSPLKPLCQMNRNLVGSIYVLLILVELLTITVVLSFHIISWYAIL
jgi:hypothetical protein